MRRGLKYIVLIVVTMLTVVGCQRQKAIPDNELHDIIKEIFLSNAYLSRELPSLKSDSLNLYEPIINDYGYQMGDFIYTLGSFTKRKSMKLSDVMDRVVDELEEESSHYRYRVSVIDSIYNQSQRILSRVVYEQSNITVDRVVDTAKLRVELAEVDRGEYKINYLYEIDSLDDNRNLKTTISIYSGEKEPSVRTNWMSLRRRQSYSTNVVVEERDSKLEIVFANYPKNLKRPYITIDSLRIVHMLPREEAADSLHKLGFIYTMLAYEERDGKTTKDSSSLHLYTPWFYKEWSVDTGPEGEDSLNRE